MELRALSANFPLLSSYLPPFKLSVESSSRLFESPPCSPSPPSTLINSRGTKRGKRGTLRSTRNSHSQLSQLCGEGGPRSQGAVSIVGDRTFPTTSHHSGNHLLFKSSSTCCRLETIWSCRPRRRRRELHLVPRALRSRRAAPTSRCYSARAWRRS